MYFVQMSNNPGNPAAAKHADVLLTEFQGRCERMVDRQQAELHRHQLDLKVEK